jgi:hypothetical protein
MHPKAKSETPWVVKEFISCSTPLCSLVGAYSVAICILYKVKSRKDNTLKKPSNKTECVLIHKRNLCSYVYFPMMKKLFRNHKCIKKLAIKEILRCCTLFVHLQELNL